MANMASEKTIREIMTQEVRVVPPDAKIKDAAKVMDEINVGAVPVCDGDRLVGIITDRDIVIRSVSEGQDPNSTFVRDAMTSPINYCFEDQGVSEVARMMQEKQIRRLVVLNRSKRLVGIVALGDLAVHFAGKDVVSETTQKVSEQEKPAA